MPVYQLLCPDCGHSFSGMVFAGTREPEVWVCSECGGERARPRPRKDAPPTPHPLEAAHGSGCPCCGSGGAVNGPS